MDSKQRLRKCCRLVQPYLFLWTALDRHESVLPLFYFGLAWLAIHITNGAPQHPCRPSGICFMLAALATVPPVAEMVRGLACTFIVENPLGMLGFIFGCSDSLHLLWPTLAAAVAWLHSTCVHWDTHLDAAAGWSGTGPPAHAFAQVQSRSTAPLCALLASVAVLECNVFAVAYFATALGLMLLMALLPDGMLEPPVLRWLRIHRRVLLALASAHLAASCISVAVLPSNCKSDLPLVILQSIAAVPCCLWHNLQCQGALAIIMMLYGSEFYQLRAVTDATEPVTSIDVTIIGEDPREERHTDFALLPHLANLARGSAAELLQLASLCLWPLVLPTLSSLPLAALALPALRHPRYVLRYPGTGEAVVRYQAVLCVLSYTAICQAHGKFDQWISRMGLQHSYASSLADLLAPRLVSAAALGAMALLTLAFAWATASGHLRTTARARPTASRPEAGRTLLALRVLTITCALCLALGRTGRDGQSSWLQLGYFWWCLGLVQKHRRAAHWDVSRADPAHWRLLLDYSGAVAVAVLGWRGLAALDLLPVLGFRSADVGSALHAQLSPHLGLACLASLQVHAWQEPNVQGRAMSARAETWLLMLLQSGQFAVIQLLVFLPPASMDTFLFLLLGTFMAFVASLHISWRLVAVTQELLAQLSCAVLGLRSVILLPRVQLLLAAVMPRADYPAAWSVLALRATDIQPWRQALMVVLLLLSRTVASKVQGILGSIDEQLQQGLQEGSRKRLDCARKYLRCFLIVFAFLASASEGSDVISGLQLLISLVFLYTGSQWDWAGAILTATAGASLLLCYLSCFPDVRPPSPLVTAYWGLTWSSAHFCSSLALVLLAFLQRAVHYCAVAASAAAAAAATATAVSHSDAAVAAAEEGCNAAAGEEPAADGHRAEGECTEEGHGVAPVEERSEGGHVAKATEERHSTLAEDGPSSTAAGREHAARGRGHGEAAEEEHAEHGHGAAAEEEGTEGGHGAATGEARVRDGKGEEGEDSDEPRLCVYDTQLAAVAVLLLAELRKSAWSLAYLVVWGFFLIRSVATLPLPVEARRQWLRPAMLVLMLAMLWSTLMRVWLPPALGWPRPTPSDVGTWALCSSFEGSVLRRTDGSICDMPGEDCLSQRGRCGADWSRWLHLSGMSCAPEFLVFLCLCPLCWPRGLVPPPGAWRGLLLRQEAAATLERSGQSPSAATAVGSGDAEELWTETTGLGLLRQYCKRLRRWRRRYEGRLLLWLCTAVKWVGLYAAFITRPEWSLAAIGYLALLVFDLSSTYEAALCAIPRESLLWPARCAGVFNFGMIVASLVFQCPGVPCPYAMRLPLSDGSSYLTAYLSDRQCRRIMDGRKQLVSGPQPLSLLLRGLGLMKTNLDFRLWGLSLWNPLIFATVLLQRIAFARWRPRREQLLERKRQRDHSRANWYVDNLAVLRQLQLVSWDTKKQVLSSKLRRLTDHLDAVRAIWDGRRAAFSEEEQKENARATRTESLCLQSGAQRRKVEELLHEFSASARMDQLEACGDAEVQRMAETMVDNLLLEYLAQRDQYRLRCITQEEKANVKRRILSECRAIYDALGSELEERCAEPSALAGARSPGAQGKAGASQREGLAGVGTEGVASEAARRPRGVASEGVASEEGIAPMGSAGVQLPAKLERSTEQFLETEGRAGAPTEPAAELRHRKAKLRSSFDGGPSGGSPLRREREIQGNARAMRRRQTAMTGFAQASDSIMRLFVVRQCHKVIDDFLFIRKGDETLHEHLAGNSVRLLVWKALCSQTYQLLVAGSVLQFMMYRSVAAAISVSVVAFSLSEFPHVPWRTWVLLHWYTSVVLVLKVLFQLPVFCGDGSFRLSPSFACPDLSGYSERILLLGWKMVTPKTLGVLRWLWGDILVYAVVLLNMRAARRSGRFWKKSQILRYFQGKDDGCRSDSEEEERRPGAERSPRQSAQPRATRLWQRATRHWSTVQEAFAGPTRLRRPSRDLYSLRFSISLLCLLLLLFDWNELSGEARGIEEALMASHFSGKQVAALALFMIMVVSDRMLYTWYRYDEWDQDAGEAASAEARSFQAMDYLRERVSMDDQNTYRALARQLLRLMVVAHLAILHSYFVRRWGGASLTPWSTNELYKSLKLARFYACYMAYILASAWQLKYDVHTTRGGFRCTHSTSFFTKTLFRIYSALPFLHELRVLTDWTVTSTALDYFMWMKLEDAHHNIYRTRSMMEILALLAPGKKQPVREKIIMGGMFLFVLLLLLIGPILFFSSLNFLAFKENTVQSGMLYVDVEIRMDNTATRSLNLYTAQGDIDRNFDPERVRKGLALSNDHATFQRVTFPKSSDSIWLVPTAARGSFAKLMQSEEAKAFLVISYEFDRTATMAQAQGSDSYELSAKEVELFVEVLSANNASSKTAVIAGTTWPPNLHLSAGKTIGKISSRKQDLSSVTLTLQSDSVKGLPNWQVQQGPGRGCLEASCDIALWLVNDDIAIHSFGVSVNSLYISVVLVIGNFLRLMFKDASKLSVIYDEIPNTDLLVDLCDGIYLARLQGNLKAEYTLYYELIRILRSPELLVRVGQPQNGLAARPGDSGQPVLRPTSPGITRGNSAAHLQ